MFHSHGLLAVPFQAPSPSTSSLGKGSVVLWLLTGKPLVMCWPFLLHSDTKEKCFILVAESLNTSNSSENYNSHQTLVLLFAMRAHFLSLWSQPKERVLPSIQNLCGLEVQDSAPIFPSRMDPTSHGSARTKKVEEEEKTILPIVLWPSGTN